jgi:hypothetical protein
LRELLRYRRKLVESHTAERNRLLKLLETANIKLASVASDVFGVSGRAMLKALIEGSASPEAMADLRVPRREIWVSAHAGLRLPNLRHGGPRALNVDDVAPRLRWPRLRWPRIRWLSPGKKGPSDARRITRQMRNGSHSLGEFPLAVARVDCPRCERAGSYRLDGLLARFGAAAALPDVLLALASCDQRKDFSRPCSARFTDLATSRP